MIPDQRLAINFHGNRVRYADGWQEKLSAIGIDNDKPWWLLTPGDEITASPLTHCYRVTLEAGDVVYFKRYVYTFLKPQFYYPMASKAAVECFGYQQLKQLGIPTLEVLAVGELRRYGDIRAAFIVTRGIPDTSELSSFAQQVWYPMAEPQRSEVFRNISHTLIKQLQVTQQAHFCHHDLKWRNILVQQNADDYRLIWIDCPRARYIRLQHGRSRLVELGALARLALGYLSPYQQMRFLRQFLGAGQHLHQAKQLFLEIRNYLSRRPPRPVDLPVRDHTNDD